VIGSAVLLRSGAVLPSADSIGEGRRIATPPVELAAYALS